MTKFEFEQEAILAILRSRDPGPLPTPYFVLECVHKLSDDQEKRRPQPQAGNAVTNYYAQMQGHNTFGGTK